MPAESYDWYKGYKSGENKNLDKSNRNFAGDNAERHATAKVDRSDLCPAEAEANAS